MWQYSEKRPPWASFATVGALSLLMAFGLTGARPRGGNLWDFGSFLLSGHAATRGFNPYGKELFAAYAAEHDVTLTAPNLNPPLSVLVFQPLSKLDPLRTFRVWWGVSLGLYICCVAWLACTGPGHKLLRGLWGLSLAGLWMNLALGQIYVPLLALVAVAYRFFDARPFVAGACVGIVAAWKPHFLLWPVFLFVAGHTAVACTGLGVFVVASLLPAVLLGPNIYLAWIAAVSRYDAMHVATNASLSEWLSTFLPAGVVLVVAAAATVACTAYLARARAPARSCSDLSLALAIAISPIAWVGYTLLLLPLFLRRTWDAALTVSAVLLTVPGQLLWAWSSSHPQDIFGPRMLYPLAALLLIVGLLRQELSVAAGSKHNAGNPIQRVV